MSATAVGQRPEPLEGLGEARLRGPPTVGRRRPVAPGRRVGMAAGDDHQVRALGLHARDGRLAPLVALVVGPLEVGVPDRQLGRRAAALGQRHQPPAALDRQPLERREPLGGMRVAEQHDRRCATSDRRRRSRGSRGRLRQVAAVGVDRTGWSSRAASSDGMRPAGTGTVRRRRQVGAASGSAGVGTGGADRPRGRGRLALASAGVGVGWRAVRQPGSGAARDRAQPGRAAAARRWVVTNPRPSDVVATRQRERAGEREVPARHEPDEPAATDGVLQPVLAGIRDRDRPRASGRRARASGSVSPATAVRQDQQRPVPQVERVRDAARGIAPAPAQKPGRTGLAVAGASRAASPGPCRPSAAAPRSPGTACSCR